MAIGHVLAQLRIDSDIIGAGQGLPAVTPPVETQVDFAVGDNFEKLHELAASAIRVVLGSNFVVHFTDSPGEF